MIVLGSKQMRFKFLLRRTKPREMTSAVDEKAHRDVRGWWDVTVRLTVIMR